MTDIQRVKNLAVPTGAVDVVLDTDAFNEIDDQYAIAYLLRSTEKLNTKAIYAAPFQKKQTPVAEGMEKSYQEIFHILELLGQQRPVFRGSDRFMADEQTPVISDAARDLARRANDYSPEQPLYVVAIGAITNVASAILLNPGVAENTVVVWLGGHAYHYHDTREFNMYQDVAAARVVFSSGVPLVQLPCNGVVSAFTVSRPDLESWFVGKTPLSDYLSTITIEYQQQRVGDSPIWSKPLWDITAVAWLLNDNDRFMLSRLEAAPLPSYDNYYTQVPNSHPLRYVYHIRRDVLLRDVIEKLTN